MVCELENRTELLKIFQREKGEFWHEDNACASVIRNYLSGFRILPHEHGSKEVSPNPRHGYFHIHVVESSYPGTLMGASMAHRSWAFQEGLECLSVFEKPFEDLPLMLGSKYKSVRSLVHMRLEAG